MRAMCWSCRSSALTFRRAIAASTSDAVPSKPDGSPHLPDTRWVLVDQLRRALKRAGVVDGYRHICRRRGCGFEETRAAPSEDRCPRCRMRLWVSPVPRKLRFYDLRHTHATLLRKAGVDLGAVQRALGHSSPEITAAVRRADFAMFVSTVAAHASHGGTR